MKPCIKCGKMLPDEARFCKGCGEPQPAQTVRPVQQPMPQTAPTTNAAPAVKEKKRGFRARYVVIPLVLAVLAAAGVFVWRALQHPSEIWYYDKDGNKVSVEYYDGTEIERTEYYDEKGKVAEVEEYRVTDESKKISTEGVEEISGVKNVRAVQVVYGEPDEESLHPGNTIFVIGTDARGRTVAQEIYAKPSTGDRFLLIETIVYERDIFGNATHADVTAPDGTLLAERDYDNEYSFGRLVSQEYTITYQPYGIVIDGYEVRADPVEESEGSDPITVTAEMHY